MSMFILSRDDDGCPQEVFMTLLPLNLPDSSDQQTLRVNLHPLTKFLAVESSKTLVEAPEINAVRDNCDLSRGENLLRRKRTLDRAGYGYDARDTTEREGVKSAEREENVTS